MNPFEMVIGIVLIVTIGKILSAKYGHRRRHGLSEDGPADAKLEAENARLREEMLQLKERVKVLERITVEKENSLAREIEDLRGR
jgi:hypothetical protein